MSPNKPDMVTTAERTEPQPSRLVKLPPIDAIRVPGVVVGDMVFEKKKPSGIESGFVGFSINSEPYRKFIESVINALEQGSKDVPKDIRKRYQDIMFNNKAYLNEHLDMETKIDILLNDTIIVKAPKKELSYVNKIEMMKQGKFHETLNEDSYTNIGMGGLLLQYYKEKVLELTGNEHWSVAPNRLLEKGNSVYMVKQDYYSDGERTFQELENVLRTNTEKRKLKEKAQSFEKEMKDEKNEAKRELKARKICEEVIASTKYNINLKSFIKSCDSLNLSAISETVSTNVMAARGINSQYIELLEGTRESDKTKFVMRVGWNPKMSDFEGKLAGGNDREFNNVIYDWVPNKETGNQEPVYINGKMVANPRFYNTGEAYILILGSGDRDGLGKAGQNKGFEKLKFGQLMFFGFDYGKAYSDKNERLNSLHDDFSIQEDVSYLKKKTVGEEQFKMVNLSMLADTSLIEKMKGVYLIAAIRGKLARDHAEFIALNYIENGDDEFAKKLLEACYSENQNKDLKVIDKQISDINNLPDLKESEKQNFINELEKIKSRIISSDDKILNVFEKRINLLPYQIEALDKLEKFSSPNVTVFSPNGEVYLNHIKIDRETRISWQFTPDGKLEANFPTGHDTTLLKLALAKAGIDQSMYQFTKNKVIVNLLNKETIQAIANMKESEIAKFRGLDSKGLEYTENVRSEIKSKKLNAAESISSESSIGDTEPSNSKSSQPNTRAGSVRFSNNGTKRKREATLDQAYSVQGSPGQDSPSQDSTGQSSPSREPPLKKPKK